MKLFIPAILLLIGASASAQDNRWFYQPLGQLKDFLQLSDAQVQTILTNNNAYNEFASEKQSRISQVQGEIADETSKTTLDPMAIGIRYAEIEGICRELKGQTVDFQKKNVAVLTEAQKTKLKVLEDAMKLAPVISDAENGNLLGTPSYVPTYFTSTSSSSTSGGFYFVSSGCYSPITSMRNGDFSSTANGTSRLRR